MLAPEDTAGAVAGRGGAAPLCARLTRVSSSVPAQGRGGPGRRGPETKLIVIIFLVQGRTKIYSRHLAVGGLRGTKTRNKAGPRPQRGSRFRGRRSDARHASQRRTRSLYDRRPPCRRHIIPRSALPSRVCLPLMRVSCDSRKASHHEYVCPSGGCGFFACSRACIIDRNATRTPSRDPAPLAPPCLPGQFLSNGWAALSFLNFPSASCAQAPAATCCVRARVGDATRPVCSGQRREPLTNHG